MKAVVTAVILCAGLYFLVAGIIGLKEHEGQSTPKAVKNAGGKPVALDEVLVFPDERALQKFMKERNAEKFASRFFFNWVFETPDYLIPLLLAAAGGLAGGAAQTLRRLVAAYSNPTNAPVSWGFLLVAPVVSAFVGLMLFFLCYLLPTLFNFDPMGAYFIAGLSILGGFIAEHTSAWIEQVAKSKLFPIKPEEQKK